LTLLAINRRIKTHHQQTINFKQVPHSTEKQPSYTPHHGAPHTRLSLYWKMTN